MMMMDLLLLLLVLFGGEVHTSCYTQRKKQKHENKSNKTEAGKELVLYRLVYVFLLIDMR